MTTVNVEPNQLQFGDPVIIDNDQGTIRVVEGPDQHGTFDIYLDNSTGGCHKIVKDPVQLIIHE